MLVRDGFPGQRLQVLPGPTIEKALERVPTSLLLCTDAGYFPHAVHHGRRRRQGALGAILIVCTEGTGSCDSDGRTHSVGAGDALILGPGVPHLYRAGPGAPWTIWWVHLAGCSVQPWMTRLGAADGPVVLSLPEVNAVVDPIADIVLTLESDSEEALIKASVSGWRLLSKLALAKLGGQHSASEPILLAQEYLREHLDAPLRVADLAERVGISTSHFAALFRRATDGGVITYLTRLRMARARELIILTDKSIAEIAPAVGYQDPYYFSRQFRKAHGCSPTQFRSDYRQGLVAS